MDRFAAWLQAQTGAGHAAGLSKAEAMAIIRALAKRLRTTQAKALDAAKKLKTKMRRDGDRQATFDDALRRIRGELRLNVQRVPNKGKGVSNVAEEAWLEFTGFPVDKTLDLWIPNLPKNSREPLVGVPLAAVDYDMRRKTDDRGRPSDDEVHKHFTHQINQRGNVWLVWDAKTKTKFYIGFKRKPRKALVGRSGIEL